MAGIYPFCTAHSSSLLAGLRAEDGIDPARKEEYLSAEEFVKVMCRCRFGAVNSGGEQPRRLCGMNASSSWRRPSGISGHFYREALPIVTLPEAALP